jgi:hypothetical protein
MTHSIASIPSETALANAGSQSAAPWRGYPLAWAFWWVVIPNIIVIAMWPVGGPGMAFSIGLCGVAAAAANFSGSLWLKRIAVVAIMAFNALMYCAYTFNLDLLNLFTSLEFALELDPLSSPEYGVAGLLFVGAMAAAVRFAPHCPRFVRPLEVFRALALVALIACIDTVVTRGTSGSYMLRAPDGAPVNSAMAQNRVAPGTLAARNLVVIVVEALGEPVEPEDRALFEQAWGASRWSARYDVASGTTPYYGSTTAAELREWCGVWSDHQSFNFGKADCLPGRFAAAGFQTTVLHTFESTMFNRREWYPRIGFQKMLFREDLERLGAGKCGGVFPGACDRDIPRAIGKMLRADPGQRKLIYWLTLNSHLPVPADEALDTQQCQIGTPQWRKDFPMLCRSYLLQKRLADAIHAEVMQPGFPESDVLIVGDHMPPFFQRAIRSRYDARHVPWIYLRARRAGQ